MLTAEQVVTDVMSLLEHSTLSNEVTGKVYREGYRPRDSRDEDIIVGFVTGTPRQVEYGAVTLHIYVADIVNADGTSLKDGRRVAQIEQLADAWVSSIKSTTNYKFNLLRTISSIADETSSQHIVVVQLDYQYKN